MTDKPMSKEEAEASVKDMADFVRYMDGTCERCGKRRADCPVECVEYRSKHMFEKEPAVKKNKTRDMYCKHCGKDNPFSYFAPYRGICICYDCARERGYLNSDGELKEDISLL